MRRWLHLTEIGLASALKLVLALDQSFERLASIALASTLIHNSIAQVVVVAPHTDTLTEIEAVCRQFGTAYRQLAIAANSPIHRLPARIKPYFYCVDALEQVCRGSGGLSAGRYLYLDADILCIRPITELITLDLPASRPIAACSHGRPMADRSLCLGLDSPIHYFNAGVMLFEAEGLAASFSASQVVSYYLQNSALCRFREQCALNALLKNQLVYLPSQYNYLSWMRERAQSGPWHDLAINPMAYCLQDVRRELAIVHFSAGQLPPAVAPSRHEPMDRYWIQLAGLLEAGPLRGAAFEWPAYQPEASV